MHVLLAPPSVGVKRTASQLTALGADGLLVTPPAASTDGPVKGAMPPNAEGSAVPTTCPKAQREPRFATTYRTENRTAASIAPCATPCLPSTRERSQVRNPPRPCLRRPATAGFLRCWAS